MTDTKTIQAMVDALQMATAFKEGGMQKARAALRAGQQLLGQEGKLTTCNCRWDGDTQVRQCTLHAAHVDAIHEWAERAKTAEAKLAQQGEQQEPVWVGLTDKDLYELWNRKSWDIEDSFDYERAIEAKLREKNAAPAPKETV